ncbi:hypothetical protein QFZ99_001437 [Paraburkholderia atlantica]|uniref:ATP-binding protein n=1 Tax=Paraburkholderia atlantica TaxID=2654982 RepID=UPI003D263C71
MSSIEQYSEEWRRSKLLQHPLLDTTGPGILWTNPVVELYNQIARCIVLRTGAFVQETSGQGKSSAMKLVFERLRDVFIGLIFVEFIAQTNRVPSVRAFFMEFLASLHHPKKSGETWTIRDRVRRKLEDMAVICDNSMIVLWVDEAQALTPDDFLFLRDVQNGVRDIGKELVIFLCGEEPYLYRLIVEVSRRCSPAINRRFALSRLRLRGYGNTDLASLFEQIDGEIWPPSSDITWTQFFLPNAFDGGFRLKDEAESCMTVLKNEGLLDADERCQPWLIRAAISRLFLELADEDSKDFKIAEEDWVSAIRDAAGMDIQEVG